MFDMVVPLGRVSSGESGSVQAGEHTAAGFPSPAEDYMERQLDLNEYMVQRPEASYFVRVSGESMTGAGIHDGDLLLVDRSLQPVSGCVVIASVNGDFTVKRLGRSCDGSPVLLPDNPDYDSIHIEPDSEFEVWGVVLYAVHKVQAEK